MLYRSYRGKHYLAHAALQCGWPFSQHQGTMHNSQHFMGCRSLTYKIKALIPDLLLQDEMKIHRRGL